MKNTKLVSCVETDLCIRQKDSIGRAINIMWLDTIDQIASDFQINQLVLNVRLQTVEEVGFLNKPVNLLIRLHCLLQPPLHPILWSVNKSEVALLWHCCVL